MRAGIQDGNIHFERFRFVIYSVPHRGASTILSLRLKNLSNNIKKKVKDSINDGK